MWVVIEGGDGVGKTTLIERLSNSFPAQLVREPGGTPCGEWVRSLLHGKLSQYEPPVSQAGKAMLALLQDNDERFRDPSRITVDDIDNGLELCLFLLARADLYGNRTHDTDVLQDRGMMSTMAYQVVDLETEQLITRYGQYAWPTWPDVTILLDLPAEIAATRMDSRTELDRIEQRGLAYFTSVRNRYLAVAQEWQAAGKQVVIIDASLPPDAVYEEALTAIKQAKQLPAIGE